MRPGRLAALGGLVLLVAAAPAIAQVSAKPSPSAPPGRTASAQPAPATPLLSALPAAKAAEQCRMDCARTYYFCLAQNEAQDCAPQWGQCRIDCNAAQR